MEWSGLKDKAYKTGFNELVDKGYLIQDNKQKNKYKFYIGNTFILIFQSHKQYPLLIFIFSPSFFFERNIFQSFEDGKVCLTFDNKIGHLFLVVVVFGFFVEVVKFRRKIA